MPQLLSDPWASFWVITNGYSPPLVIEQEEDLSGWWRQGLCLCSTGIQSKKTGWRREKSVAKAGRKCVPVDTSAISFAILAAAEFLRQLQNQYLRHPEKQRDPRKRKKGGQWWSEEDWESCHPQPQISARWLDTSFFCVTLRVRVRETDPPDLTTTDVRRGDRLHVYAHPHSVSIGIQVCVSHCLGW